MRLLDSLFGEKIPNENKSKDILECATVEERVEWFARTRPWHKTPAWLVNDVVNRLPGKPPKALALFVRSAEKAKLVEGLQTLRRVEPSSVACATISGLFHRVGGPLAQELLRGKGTLNASDKQVALARDCLRVAVDLYADPPSAHFLLAVLLARKGQAGEALDVAEDGLWRVEDALADLELEDPDDDLGDRKELEEERDGLKKLIDVITPAANAQGASEDPKKNRGITSRPPGPAKVLVEYSKDQGKRGPDWMQNNVDPILGMYFTPQPNDQAWSQITAENVAAYQLWFQRAVLAAKLHEAFSSESLVGERAEAVCKTAFKAKEEHGLNPLLILVLAHQYVEADQMLRGLHTVDWVAFMMKRDACAPPPESVARFVIDFYGLQRTA
jgi:hypothetical protein